MIKCDIRRFSIQFSSTQKKAFNKIEQLLDCDINLLESHIHANLHDLQCINKLQDKKKELEKLIEYKTKGILIRSKARGDEEGEKHKKYFLNLEKRNYLNKTITKLEIDGLIETDPKKILDAEKKFYVHLYKSIVDDNQLEMNEMNQFFTEPPVKVLSEPSKIAWEGQLNIEECLTCVKSLA